MEISRIGSLLERSCLPIDLEYLSLLVLTLYCAHSLLVLILYKCSRFGLGLSVPVGKYAQYNTTCMSIFQSHTSQKPPHSRHALRILKVTAYSNSQAPIPNPLPPPPFWLSITVPLLPNGGKHKGVDRAFSIWRCRNYTGYGSIRSRRGFYGEEYGLREIDDLRWHGCFCLVMMIVLLFWSFFHLIQKLNWSFTSVHALSLYRSDVILERW